MLLSVRFGYSETECSVSVSQEKCCKCHGIVTAFEITIENYMKELFPCIPSGSSLFSSVVKPIII